MRTPTLEIPMLNSLARRSLAMLAAALAACADPTASPLATSGPGGVAADVAEETAQNQLLATIREATARYHGLDAALADGYVLASECEAIPEGGIGVHYRKSSLFDVVVDPAQPELLVYEPQQNGDRRLVAVRGGASETSDIRSSGGRYFQGAPRGAGTQARRFHGAM